MVGINFYQLPSNSSAALLAAILPVANISGLVSNAVITQFAPYQLVGNASAVNSQPVSAVSVVVTLYATRGVARIIQDMLGIGGPTQVAALRNTEGLENVTSLGLDQRWGLFKFNLF